MHFPPGTYIIRRAGKKDYILPNHGTLAGDIVETHKLVHSENDIPETAKIEVSLTPSGHFILKGSTNLHVAYSDETHLKDTKFLVWSKKPFKWSLESTGPGEYRLNRPKEVDQIDADSKASPDDEILKTSGYGQYDASWEFIATA